MRQCERCKFYVPDDAQFCANCGNSLIVSPTVTSTMPSQTPGRPPEPPRRQRYTYFIPGLGAFGLFRRDSATGQWGCAPGCLITSVLVAVLSLGGFLFLHNSSSQASLSVDHAVPGGTMHVHGSNFPPGARVKVAVDENTAASYTLALAAISDSTFHNQLLVPTDAIVIVQIDGTFDAMLPVPASWLPGSHHIIRAIAQNAQTSAQASTDVETGVPGQTATVPTTVTPTPTPTATPTPQPSPTPTPAPQPSPPTVSSLDPSSGPASGGTTVTINGSSFTGATGVSFGSTAATSVNVVSDTQITAVSPANSGTVDVTVTTPNGNSKTSNADQFTYNTTVSPPSAPTVSSLDTTSGPSAGGTKVIIIGSGFTGAISVAFGKATVTCGSGSTCSVDSDTQITVTSPAEDPSDTSSPVDVTVTTPSGTSQTSGSDQFTYTIPLPVVTNISPASGSINGGDTVIVTGSGFTGATSVAFDKTIVNCGTASSDNLLKSWDWAQSVFNARFGHFYNPLNKNGQSHGGSCTVNSDTQITVVTPTEDPSESSNPVDVTVTTPNGTSQTSSADQFTYLPEVDSINPRSGPPVGGTTVTITGSGFTGATAVSFGPTAGTDVTVVSDTQITVVSPAGSGTVDVTVTTSAGTSQTSSSDQFTYTLVISHG